MRRGFFSRINTPVPSLPTRNEWAQSWKEENLNQTRPLSSSHSSFLRQEEREKCSAIGHFSTQRFRRGSDLRSDGSRSLRLRVLGNGKLQARGPANRPTGGLTHPSTGAATQCPCHQGPGGKRAWLENQSLDYASIRPLAGFRRLGNATDLRLTITSRASCPTSVAPPGARRRDSPLVAGRGLIRWRIIAAVEWGARRLWRL